ncbi:pirin family protein [Roseomonas hellenica]|uniref:Pirin family protein n=1 Tax=Plastoroseomonas hellenica TaxID=2687306 RepID=A0ABS5EWU1_9PROT|nr:pirin family protein [Plastoroseomonas hellenica]
MVDHCVITAPLFEPHLHTSISAVTAIFEDSEGAFVDRDTLGHSVALRPSDLYWLALASGATHEERPEDGARTHALQTPSMATGDVNGGRGSANAGRLSGAPLRLRQRWAMEVSPRTVRAPSRGGACQTAVRAPWQRTHRA